MLLQLEINLANRCSGSPVGIESFQFVHALVLKAQLSGLMGLPLKHPPFSRSLGESTFQSFGDCTALSIECRCRRSGWRNFKAYSIQQCACTPL